MDDLALIMISAMYENGGNTVHRHLDGHPQLEVYPFESQLGTRLVSDHLVSLFPVKYRWPVFALHGTAAEDYAAIIDEECKVRTRTPHVSKFRHVRLELSDAEREATYVEHVRALGRSRAANVAAFFRATFDVWRNRRRTGREIAPLGYSPIVIVDADKILADFPGGHVIHVVRNPWSAFAETKRRPVPLALDTYMLAWTVTQQYARVHADRWHGRVHIVRYEDLVVDPYATLSGLCAAIGLESAETLRAPSWNGEPLAEVAPWGTIRQATPDANRATAATLTPAEADEIRVWAGAYLESLDYKTFLRG